MKTQSIAKLLTSITLIIIMILGEPLRHQAAAQGGIRLRLPFSGTRRLTAYVDHRSPTYGLDTYSNIVVYNGEDRVPCADCDQAWTTQGPYCYNGHDGTDYALDCGTPVLAAADGTVTFLGTRYGETIEIDHGSGYVTRYAHLTLGSNTVNVGNRVVTGQQIATSGSSGTTACHLHFGVYRNGDVTDPFGWRGSGQDPLAGGAVCLWGDGQCSEIVVEDESDGFSKFSEPGVNWNWDCHGNSWTMRWIANKNTDRTVSATWRPKSPYSGPYAVEVFVAAVHHSTGAAKYTVYDKDGYHNVIITQTNYADAWVSLGTYNFWGDVVDSVYLNNATGEPDNSREVCFDTIRFRQFRVYLPAVLNNYP